MHNSPSQSGRPTTGGKSFHDVVEASIDLSTPNLTDVSAAFSSSQLAPLGEGAEVSAGISGKIKRGVGALLCSLSMGMGKAWLNFVNATDGDRVQIASGLMKESTESRAAICRELEVSTEVYAQKVAETSAVEAFRTIEELDPSCSKTLIQLAHLAFQRGESGSYSLLANQHCSDERTQLFLWEAANDENPLLAVANSALFTQIPDTAVNAAYNRLILNAPLDVARNLEKLPRMNSTLSEEFVQRIIEENPSALVKTLPYLSLELDNLVYTTRILTVHSPKTFLEECHKLDLPQEDRAMLVEEVFQSDPEESLEALATLLDWSDRVTLPENLSEDRIHRFWRRILTNRERLGFTDPDKIRELVLRKIQTHPHLVAKHLESLGLEREACKDELALALAKADGSAVPDIISMLEVSGSEKLNALICEYAKHDPKRAARFATKQGIELSEETQQSLFEARSRKSPWTVLGELLEQPERDEQQLVKVAVLCARKNATRMTLSIEELDLPSQKSRERVFEECAKRNFWKTVEAHDNFDIRGTAAARAIYAQALQRNYKRAVEYRDALGLDTPEDLRNTLNFVVKKNSSQAIELLENTQKVDSEVAADILEQAVRRNPGSFWKAVDFLEGLPTVLQEKVIAARCKGDIRKSKQIFEESMSSTFNPLSLATACAQEDFATAKESGEGSELEVFQDTEFLGQLIGNSILHGRWNSALEAAKHLAALTEGEDEVNTTHALKLTDGVCRALSQQAELEPQESENVMLFQRIRKANCIPTDLIQRTLDHFGADDYPFIFDIFQQGGSTVAETTCELLLGAYPTEVDIRPIDESIIQACLSLSFRGLSPKLLRDLRPVFEESTYEGRATLKNYKALSAKVLNGQPIDPEWERSPLYPGIVTTAFRPVGMTEASVARTLHSIKDQSSHLKNFTFPQDGYVMKLAQTSRVDFLPHQQADLELYRRLASIFAEPEAQSQSVSSSQLIKRVLQGGFDQLDPQGVWQLFVMESEDPRVLDLQRKIRAAKDPAGMTPRAMAEYLNQCAEALGVVTYDAIVEISKKAVSDTIPEQERYRIQGKIVKQIQKILRLAPDHDVGPKELLMAIDVQGSKLFAKERRQIQKEGKKFTQHLGDLEGRYSMYLSKSKPAYFGRAGAGLCTAQETWSWNSPTFLQMMMVDRKKNVIVGNIQLHLFKNSKGKSSVLARVNPTSSFLSKVDKKTLAKEMLGVVRTFASDNNLIPYLPDQTGWHQLTNRDSFAPALRSYYGARERSNIQITRGHRVHLVFQMKESSKK